MPEDAWDWQPPSEVAFMGATPETKSCEACGNFRMEGLFNRRCTHFSGNHQGRVMGVEVAEDCPEFQWVGVSR